MRSTLGQKLGERWGLHDESVGLGNPAAFPRFTFGNTELMGGIGLIPSDPKKAIRSPRQPAAMESASRQLGESRRILAPLGWAAGTIVLLLRGVKLLILNWRLSVIQLVPAAWVWLAMWDLKRHLLHGASFRHLPLVAMLALAAAVVVFTIAAFWCNTIFAFAIDAPPPPRIAPAFRQARQIVRIGDRF